MRTALRLPETVNERVDLSVFRRCKLDKDYLPASLVEWAQRKGVDLDAVVNAPEKFPQYWSPLLQAGLESSVERSLSPPESSPGTEPRQVLPSPSEDPRPLKP